MDNGDPSSSSSLRPLNLIAYALSIVDGKYKKRIYPLISDCLNFKQLGEVRVRIYKNIFVIIVAVDWSSNIFGTWCIIGLVKKKSLTQGTV
jgi:hypothetical protein